MAVSRGWRHPAAVGAGAVALLVFGIALGAGVVRYTTPESGPVTPAPGLTPAGSAARRLPGFSRRLGRADAAARR